MGRALRTRMARIRPSRSLIVWAVKLPIVAGIALCCIVGLSGAVIAHRSQGVIHTGVDTVPDRSVVIVPGARVFPSGSPSLMLEDRLDAALALHASDRVEHVLVSGDNRESHYNEPVAMRNHLVAAGLDAVDVTLDYAGLDTWDTCLRAREQFGVTDAVVVTQHRHAQRTAALCRAAGIDAVVLAVDHPAQRRTTQIRNEVREALAKVKAWADIVRHPPARHGGPRVGLVGSVGMPAGGHPPDWNWERRASPGD